MRGAGKVYQRKIVAKKRRRLFYHTFYSLCLAALIVAGLSYLSHLDALSISAVEVRGNERLPASDAEGIAWRELSGNYQGLFSKRNALLYPKGAIRSALESVPLVRSAAVERDGRTLILEVSERKEEALWCESEGEAAFCFSIDGSGFVFASVFDSASSTERFVYRGVIEEEPIGKHFLDGQEFKKIQFFMTQLSGLSVDPREADLSETGSMTISLGTGGRIVVDRRDDLSVVLGNIAAVISDRQVAPDLREFLETLDYIKFDAGNKVVYKIRE